MTRLRNSETHLCLCVHEMIVKYPNISDLLTGIIAHAFIYIPELS
jgi:hypothetical protein